MSSRTVHLLLALNLSQHFLTEFIMMCRAKPNFVSTSSPRTTCRALKNVFAESMIRYVLGDFSFAILSFFFFDNCVVGLDG